MKKVLFALVLLLSTTCTVNVLAQGKSSYVFVFLHKRADLPELPKAEVDKLMEGHMANINKMAKEGKLLVAGPFEGGGGIFVFNTASRADVTEWLKADPGIRAERWRLEMLTYTPNTGGVCNVGESYQMVMYSFVRFTPNIAKFNVQNAPELFGKHDRYVKDLMKDGNTIAEGTFGDTEGGIWIVKGDLNKEAVEKDPAVREGLLELDIKKLYTAKGAFCEN
jgi:uncharacterized protein YciI